MISVVMSSSSGNNPFESVRENDTEEESKPRVLVSDDEKVNLGTNSTSVVSDEDGMSSFSMHVDENARVAEADGFGGVSLVVDYKGSEENKVSEGVDEVSEFRVLELKNADEDLKNVSGSGFSEVGSQMKEMKQFGSGDGEDVKVEYFKKENDDIRDGGNGNFEAKDQGWKDSGADYDSLLSMFDQYAANGKSEAVGYGYEIGDMVWGKVKSHPWWPGHIFNEAFASASVRRSKREGHVLVAFFGDSSYGWFDPAELVPFEPNLAEKSKQTNSRTFVKAVEDAVDEVNRRQGLGLACKCRNQFNFRKTNIEGYFAVDVADYEAGYYSASQIKKARDSFQPVEMLDFVKQLALTPMSDDFGSINFIKNRATVSAYRKEVFEEYDETYAQAFGAQPVRSAPVKAPPEPSRVPLSGRLVFAEALGKGKASSKSNKSKDQQEKDKYLFKRRDEPNELKTHVIGHGQGGSSSQPPQGVNSVLPVEGMHPAVVGQAGQTSVPRAAGGFEQSATRPAAIEQLRGQEHTHGTIVGNYHSDINDLKPVPEGRKKVKQHKRPAGELNPGKTLKKRKTEANRENSLHNVVMPGLNVQGSALEIVRKPVEEFSVIGDNTQVKHLGNDDTVRGFLLPDVGTKPSIVDNDTQLELPQLLDYLRALALNPFHGAERNCPAIVRQVILRFRSLVYQKSVSSLVPGENDSKDARGMMPSPSAPFDNPSDSTREMSSVKPPKPPTRLEDPTKGGRKRAPSDRQEELTLKKKKKMNDLKSLTTGRKAAHKAPEAQRGNRKDTSTKAMAQAPEKKPAQKPPEIRVGDGVDKPRKSVLGAPPKVSRLDRAKSKALPTKAADPTMLVMKFPAEAALPSSAELRAKFARFGPLDHSGTRIFWKTSTIRLIYHHKIDAQAALRFATTGANLFGSTNVRCYLRDVESPETDSTKIQEDPYLGILQPRDSPALPQRLATTGILQPVQLKSCLKKPSGDDGPSTGGGNGTVRGRVKFMLGDEVSVRTSSDDAATSSHGLNYNSEKIHHKVLAPPPSSILPVPTQQFPVAPNNSHHTELVPPRNVQTLSMPAAQPMPTHTDISQQMISLLTKCKDVLNNLTGAMGYVPYHPL